MKSCLFIVLLQILMLTGMGQFSVSENNRFILREGKPFFWLGDTGWELFHRLTLPEADEYLQRRSKQGFTVIQAVALAELDGLHVPNAYGELPLVNDDPARPNEAYFKRLDAVIDKAAEYNLVIGLLPTWGDKIFMGTWGKGPEIFTVDNAAIFGKWIGNRYKSRKNIIWILGGDRNPQNQTQVTIWRNMAKGIVAGTGPANKPMITFHPQPNETGSAEWFHQDEWLSFNMFQNGHCRNVAIYDKIQAVYNLQPAKPVMDGEPLYEDHPVCFNAKDLGTSNAYDTRMYAYLDLFAGAHGHTYGCHDIWQFYASGRQGVNGPHVFWQQAIDLPGAQQMQYVKRLMLSRPFLERIPDQSLIVENNNAAAERIQATRGIAYAFIYSAMGKSFTINLGKISGTTLNAYWFSPVNGSVSKLGLVPNKGQLKFTPPSTGYGKDWVLILDDAAKNYPVPE